MIDQFSLGVFLEITNISEGAGCPFLDLLASTDMPGLV